MKKLVLLFILMTFAATAQHQSKSSQPKYLPNTINIRVKTPTSLDKLRTALAPLGAVPIRQMLQPSQSVRYSPAANLRLSESSKKLQAIIDAESPLLRTFVVQFTAVQSPQKYCTFLMEHCPLIEIAEPSIIERTMSKPNDIFTAQQNLLTIIKAFEAWDISKGDASVVIGICDNGIYQDHEDITNSIAVNSSEIPDNKIDDDQNGYIDDYRGVNITAIEDATPHGNTFCEDSHGSSVAGIAGATTNNGIGISGVGYNCKIFPIKTGYVSKSDVYSGYEGMIYAAVRGFKVVNCSWGSPNSYSIINETIVRYVQSRDVAIVAAAGNGTGIVPWYPAGYAGVLGVGETEISDEATFMSAVGAHSSIMAPGFRTITITNKQNDYTQSFAGSSASAPIVAGVVAIVRTFFPNLTAEQAIEHVRLTADNIEQQNSNTKGIIAGRVNMLKALTILPTSHPSLRPISWDLRVRGASTSQFFKGDTVTLSVLVKNYLAPSGDLTATLSVKEQFFPFVILDSSINVPPVATNATTAIATFRFVIPEENTELTFLRITLKGTNYDDYFLLPFHPTSDMATFSNDSIAVSMGNVGQFGFAGQTVTWRGIGLTYSDYGNLLYSDAGASPNHCFIVTDGDDRLETASVDGGDFVSLKNFTTPERNMSIISDSIVDVSSRIGVEIRRTIAMSPVNAPSFKVRYDIKNISGTTIRDISVGQYLDVDIGAYGIFNYARLLPEAIPAGIAGAAEIIGRDGTFILGDGRVRTHPMLGCLVLPVSPNGTPQIAGVNVNEFMPNGFTNEKKTALINSGSSLQASIKGDVGLASGMKFPGAFPAGETRSFEVCYGVGMSKDALAQVLLQSATINSVEELPSIPSTTWTVTPNPAKDEVRIVSASSLNLSGTATLINSIGERLRELTFEGHSMTLPTSDIPTGVYYLSVTSGTMREIITIIILH
jgi:serine protease